MGANLMQQKPIEGGVSLDVEFKKIDQMAADPQFWDPELQQADRIELLGDVSPTFKAMQPEERLETYQGIVNQFAPPEIRGLQQPESFQPPMPSLSPQIQPGSFNDISLQTGFISGFPALTEGVGQLIPEINKGLTTFNLAAGSVLDPANDAFDFGYTNISKNAEDRARQQYPGIQTDPGLLGQAYRLHQNGWAKRAGELVGMLGPFQNIERFTLGQLQKLAKQGAPWAAKALGSNFFKQAGRAGVDFGIYEALKKQEGGLSEQFDPVKRLQSAAAGFGIGATAQPLFKGAGQLLKGGINIFRNTSNPTNLRTPELDFMRSIQQYPRQIQEALIEEFDLLQKYAGKPQELQNLIRQKFRERTQKKLQMKGISKDTQAERQAEREFASTLNPEWPAAVKANLVKELRTKRATAKKQEMENQLLQAWAQAFKESEAATSETIASGDTVTVGRQGVFNELQQLLGEIEAGAVKVPESTKKYLQGHAIRYERGAIEKGETEKIKRVIKKVRELYKKEGTASGQKTETTQATTTGETSQAATETGQKEAVSPFSEIPEKYTNAPTVVGYINKEIGEKAGNGEGPITVGKQVLDKIDKKHKRDYLRLGLQNAKEYIEHILKNADVAYKNQKDGSILVVYEGEGGHVTALHLYKDTKSKRYIAKTAFSPEFKPGQQVNGKTALQAYIESKNLESVWSRSSSVKRMAPSSSSQQTPPLEGQGDEPTANGQTDYSQDSTPESGIKPSQPLSGNIQKLVDKITEQMNQIAQSVGRTVDELLAAKPKDLTNEESAARTNIKDLQGNIEAVQKAEPVDAEKGVYMQKDVNPATDLTYEEIAHLVDNQKLGEALRDAAKNAQTGRAEYRAEISGRSDKAVTVTAKGNVKEIPTDFTPLSFGKATKITNPEAVPINPKTNKPYGKDTKVVKELIESGEIQIKEYPLVRGYNESGHYVTYHLNESPEGSRLLKFGKTKEEAFRGDLPNVYQGPREFKAEDVLNRGIRSEEGFIKTSEAKETAQQFAEFLKSDTFKTLPKNIRDILNQAKKKGRFSKNLAKYILKEVEKEAEAKAELCKILELLD